MIHIDVFCVNSRNPSVYLSDFKCYFVIKRNFSAYLLNHADSLISWSLRVRSFFLFMGVKEVSNLLSDWTPFSLFRNLLNCKVVYNFESLSIYVQLQAQSDLKPYNISIDKKTNSYANSS